MGNITFSVVDTSTGRLCRAMSKESDRAVARQIVGFSLPPALAREVKEEAARRGLSLRDLFVDMWATYRGAKGRKA